jgi:hypothetical protein
VRVHFHRLHARHSVLAVPSRRHGDPFGICHGCQSPTERPGTGKAGIQAFRVSNGLSRKVGVWSDQHTKGIGAYSQRSDFKGSAPAARTAGAYAAEMATSASVAGTATKVRGSVALTP